MKLLKKSRGLLFICLIATFFTHTGNLWLKNNSRWALSVFYTKNGSNPKPPVLRQNQQINLGDVNAISKLSIGTYGDFYGLVTKALGPKDLTDELQKAKKRKEANSVIIISMGYFGWGTEVKTFESEQLPQPVLKDPINLFQKAKALSKTAPRSEWARYVLGFQKDEKLTKKDIDLKYKQLLSTYKRQEIQKIIHQAAKILYLSLPRPVASQAWDFFSQAKAAHNKYDLYRTIGRLVFGFPPNIKVTDQMISKKKEKLLQKFDPAQASEELKQVYKNARKIITNAAHYLELSQHPEGRALLVADQLDNIIKTELSKLSKADISEKGAITKLGEAIIDLRKEDPQVHSAIEKLEYVKKNFLSKKGQQAFPYIQHSLQIHIQELRELVTNFPHVFKEIKLPQLREEYKKNKELLHLSYYQILGVPEHAKTPEITNAYIRLSTQFDPEKNPNDPVAKHIYNIITQAHKILQNEETRNLYDAIRIHNPEKEARKDAPLLQ